MDPQTAEAGPVAEDDDGIRTGYGASDEDPEASPGPSGPHGRWAEGTSGKVCELCGGPVLDRHCKVVCLNCGYQRDCSDP